MFKNNFLLISTMEALKYYIEIKSRYFITMHRKLKRIIIVNIMKMSFQIVTDTFIHTLDSEGMQRIFTEK
jgi:hypothetical protein